jgi:cytochrome c
MARHAIWRGATAGLTLAALLALPGDRAVAADVAYGEHLSGECVTCHRKDGSEKGIPAIIGWPQDQFVAVLKSYKAKERPHALMQTIAGRLTDEDMAALAAYYATLKPPAK